MLKPCRIPFRTIVVSLLSHQVLLQNLYDILLEEFVKNPDDPERITPVTSDPSRATVGFLRYISMTNLAIILDLLLDSYRSQSHTDQESCWFHEDETDVLCSSTGRLGTLTPARV